MASVPRPAASSPTPQELAEAFEAMRRVGLVMKTRFQQAMAEHGLTYPQWLLMKQLREKGRLTAREVAEALDVTPANVTGILDRLEREGLVARARSGEDRRVVFVRLTEPGHARMKAVEDAGHSRILAEAFAGWTAEDLRTLRDLLGRLHLPETQGC